MCLCLNLWKLLCRWYWWWQGWNQLHREEEPSTWTNGWCVKGPAGQSVLAYTTSYHTGAGKKWKSGALESYMMLNCWTLLMQNFIVYLRLINLSNCLWCQIVNMIAHDSSFWLPTVSLLALCSSVNHLCIGDPFGCRLAVTFPGQTIGLSSNLGLLISPGLCCALVACCWRRRQLEVDRKNNSQGDARPLKPDG